MTVFEKIKEKFDSAGVAYDAKEHGPTGEDVDRAHGYDPALRPHRDGAKAIIIKGKKTESFYYFTLPDDRRLDAKKVKDLIGERWSFASTDEVMAVSGCVPGSVPPFGSLFGYTTYTDQHLTETEHVFFNAGSLTQSIRMKTKDYLDVETPTLVDVTA